MYTDISFNKTIIQTALNSVCHREKKRGDSSYFLLFFSVTLCCKRNSSSRSSVDPNFFCSILVWCPTFRAFIILKPPGIVDVKLYRLRFTAGSISHVLSHFECLHSLDFRDSQYNLFSKHNVHLRLNSRTRTKKPFGTHTKMGWCESQTALSFALRVLSDRLDASTAHKKEKWLITKPYSWAQLSLPKLYHNLFAIYKQRMIDIRTWLTIITLRHIFLVFSFLFIWK